MNLGDLANKRILLDSNLLVLLCVGLTGADNIARHKRSNRFDEVDWEILIRIVEAAMRIVVSPYSLSETSNLLRQSHSNLSRILSLELATVIRQGEESTVPSIELVSHQGFIRLGLTDTALLEVLDRDADIHLLTADLDLYLAASIAHYNATNFAHLQALRPDFQ